MSNSWLRVFRSYARRYVRKHVHAVRLAHDGSHGQIAEITGPVVVVMNHPSWWDPMIGLVLLDLWPSRFAHFAPIEAAGLEKYRFLERLGFFPIESSTTRGGLQFLRTSLDRLQNPDTVLWVTAQGRFADPRERPTRLKDGVGHLAFRLKAGWVLPLALEYPFWDERTPEALVRFGEPLSLESEATPEEWTQRIANALEASQNALAAAAITRDPNRFEAVLMGAAGVGGVYDLWRRGKAFLRGEPFVPEHGAVKPS